MLKESQILVAVKDQGESAMKHHPSYKAAKAARRTRYGIKLLGIFLLIGSIALAIESGEGDVLLISIPASLYTIIKGVD